MIDALGVLLVVAAIGFVLNRQESVFIGATRVIQAGQFQYQVPYSPPAKFKAASKPAPKPMSRPQSTGGGVGGPSTKQKYDTANRQQAVRNKRATLSQVLARLTPAQRNKVTQSWVIWARKRALVIAKRLIIQRQQSGYQTVGYGGFGGSDPGAVGSAVLQATQLSGLGLGKGNAASQSKEYQDASNHLKRFAACDKDKQCQLREIRRYDGQITTTINNTLSKHGGAKYDPLAEQTRS